LIVFESQACFLNHHKACHNVVNLLAVDAKTFVYYKKNNINITAYKADMKFSGWKGWGGYERGGKPTDVDEIRKVTQKLNRCIITSHFSQYLYFGTVKFSENGRW
jgi:hypothetical protein